MKRCGSSTAGEKSTAKGLQKAAEKMIGIVDHGMGNLLSVYHAVDMAGGEPRICARPEELSDVERILLPGVGSFAQCVMNLRERGFVEALEENVVRKGKPFFGICLGMQVLARRGFEGGEHAGLGWFEGEVVVLKPSDPTLRVPQIGWNTVHYLKESPLFKGLPAEPDFYFVHSYAMRPQEDSVVDGTCEYGGTITVAVRRDNIFASQFHPEKSQEFGLRVLENFLTWNP
jgi:glutamine amidotransferase